MWKYVSLVAISLTATQLDAVEAQKPRAARSVHLWYPAPDSTVFYNEVKVEESCAGTYFCVCAFRHGYFGIQERINDKVVLFSVWDAGKQNNPNEVDLEKRVKVLHAGDGVQVSRFGGEGTGGKSIFPYQWKVGENYKCTMKVSVDGDWTTYSAFFYLNEEKRWKHLATFQTISNGDYLKGYYSFVEDFRRNGESAKMRHRAKYGNGWVRTREGEWIELTKARFTADQTPTNNINAGVDGNWFVLETGGDTENKTPLRTLLTRSSKGIEPPELPSGE